MVRKFNKVQYSSNSAYVERGTYKDVYFSPEYHNPVRYKYNSRYKNVRTIKYAGVYKHETVNKIVIPESSSDQYFTVDNICANRLDIISTKFYGYPIYWWLIALANDIIDPFNVPRDTLLRIPPITSLF